MPRSGVGDDGGQMENDLFFVGGGDENVVKLWQSFHNSVNILKITELLT